jgi:hypothetical protein
MKKKATFLGLPILGLMISAFAFADHGNQGNQGNSGQPGAQGQCVRSCVQRMQSHIQQCRGLNDEGQRQACMASAQENFQSCRQGCGVGGEEDDDQ